MPHMTGTHNLLAYLDLNDKHYQSDSQEDFCECEIAHDDADLDIVSIPRAHLKNIVLHRKDHKSCGSTSEGMSRSLPRYFAALMSQDIQNLFHSDIFLI